MNVVPRSRLDPDEVHAVLHLVDEVTDTDGTRPLSEHVMLHLRYGGDERDRNFLLYDGDGLAGYAHLDVTDPVEGSTAELVVAPAYRRHGYGKMLVTELTDDSPNGRLRLWSHGRLPAADALAAALGFKQSRALLQLRRSLYAPVPDRPIPDGVDIRTFEVGSDEDAWLEVNNRAFKDHPEQGGWTRRDIEERESEPWFDPSGFFLAEREGRLVGFHWTKVHGDDPSMHGHEAIGEVYVVGVDPSEQGTGLGAALTVVGLRYLRARGLGQVMLYVDESNKRAIHVYESLGFTHWDTDVSYRK